MPEKPKAQPSKSDEPKEEQQVRKEPERSYYYDDAHGYKEFDPEREDEESDD
jgi:hypothetical protein